MGCRVGIVVGNISSLKLIAIETIIVERWWLAVPGLESQQLASQPQLL